MSEQERSRKRASLFAEIVSAVVNPVIEDEHVAHDWFFHSVEDWQESSGSRDLIEEFATTLSDARNAVYAIQKPHKYLAQIAEWIEGMSSYDFSTHSSNTRGWLEERSEMIAKFGFWQCGNCATQSTYRPQHDKVSCC